ncbi:MAG TPA: hypothetical protein VGB51_09730 [Actinomycetota bacterium]
MAVTRPAGVSRGWAARVLGPVWRAAVVEPVREGRLRLAGAGPVEQQLARVGLVLLLGLLASVLFADLWRRGDLVFVSDFEGRNVFVPDALLPVTLLAMGVGWFLFLWGSVLASPVVRAAGGLLFLIINGTMGRPLAAAIGDEPALRWGPGVARVAYLAVPTLLLLASIGSERWRRVMRPVVFVGLAAALAALFGAQLWIHVGNLRTGILNSVPLFLNGTIDGIARFLLPMVFLAVVALVEFAYDVSEATVAPALRSTARVARLLLVGVLALKLWIILARHLGDWGTYLRDRPVASLRVVLTLGALVGLAMLARRFHTGVRDEQEFERVKERVLFGGILVLAIPALSILLMFQLAQTILSQTEWTPAYRFIISAASRTESLFEYSRAVLWGLTTVVGAVLWLRRGARPWQRELGLAMLVIGGWNIPNVIFAFLNLRPGFGYAFLDLVVTLGVAVLSLVAWRRLRTGSALALTALALFSWLAVTQGDFIGILGGFLGFPAVVVVVFGVLFALLADSALASGDGKLVPRGSRLLLWVGYLTLSATILNWLQVSHGEDLSAAVTDAGFFGLALPFAVWLVIRWWADPTASRSGPGAAAHERHDA